MNKKRYIFLISLLMFSFIWPLIFAGYVTIEDEKVAIGDGTKVVDELPFNREVEIIGQTGDRYIIKYNDSIGAIDKERIQFRDDGQPYVLPEVKKTFVWEKAPIYDITLELLKGQEFKVREEDKNGYTIIHPLKDTTINIWIDKKCVLYNELSEQERFEQAQREKGLVLHKDKWIMPEEKFELEQKAKGLIKYEGKWLTFEQVQEAKGLVKFQGRWVTPEERDRAIKAKKRSEEERKKYEEEQKAKGLVKFRGEWVSPEVIERTLEWEKKEQKKVKKTVRKEEKKDLVKYKGEWVTPRIYRLLTKGSCYEIGYEYGRGATKAFLGLGYTPPEEDFAVPERCRGTKESERGINNGARSVYEEYNIPIK